jgi:Fe2+ or Zn2+ uptake regulation protein
MPKKNKELKKAGLKATLPRIKIMEVLDHCYQKKLTLVLRIFIRNLIK